MKIQIIPSVEPTADNQLERYYVKARGCSVKPQEKNLFDYNQMVKMNRNYLGSMNNG